MYQQTNFSESICCNCGLHNQNIVKKINKQISIKITDDDSDIEISIQDETELSIQYETEIQDETELSIQDEKELSIQTNNRQLGIKKIKDKNYLVLINFYLSH